MHTSTGLDQKIKIFSRCQLGSRIKLLALGSPDLKSSDRFSYVEVGQLRSGDTEPQLDPFTFGLKAKSQHPPLCSATLLWSIHAELFKNTHANITDL